MSQDRNNKFKNSAYLTKWVWLFVYAQILTSLIAIAAGVFRPDVLFAMASSQMGLIFLSTVVAMMWIYRANYNVRILGADGLANSPGWDVGWSFVPIANLWKPYQVLKEIWKASCKPEAWTGQNAPWMMLFWWLLLIPCVLTGNYLLKLDPVEDREMIINLSRMVNGFSMLLNLMFVIMVGKIHQMQTAHAEKQGLL